MNDLVQKLMNQANVGREQAENIANVVFDFIGDRLPDPIADKVQQALKGEGGALAALEGLTDKLPGGIGDAIGGMFGGGKKD